MTRILLAAILTVATICTAYVAFLSRAEAQETWKAHAYGDRQPDSVELRAPSEPGDVAELAYHNSADRLSDTVGGKWLQLGDLRVRFRITINGPSTDDGREVITVIDIDPPEFVAFPPEASALDGETVVIRIMRPMF